MSKLGVFVAVLIVLVIIVIICWGKNCKKEAKSTSIQTMVANADEYIRGMRLDTIPKPFCGGKDQGCMCLGNEI